DVSSNRRDLRRWAVPSDSALRSHASTSPEEIEPESGWAIRLQDLRGEIRRQIDNAPSVLAVSSDGKRVACGRRNGAANVWNLASRREIAAIPPLKRPKFSRFWVQRLTFSPDAAQLALLRREVIKRRDGFAVSVWSLPRGEQQKGPTEKVSVNDVAF